MLCRDKATTYLQRSGYNVVRHPREGIAPFDVLGRQRGAMIHLGTLDKLLSKPGPLPSVKKDQSAAGLVGQSTGDLKLGVGLSLLKSVLGALGGNVAVSASYQHAQTISFNFDNIKADTAAPLDIAKFLNDRVLESDPLLDRYAEGDGQLYVITETIKTNKLSVTSKRSDKTELNLDVKAIQGAVGTAVEVQANGTEASTISYVGKKQLVFGFRCLEIGLEDGEFKLFVSQPGSGTAMSLTVASTDNALLTPDRLLNIDFSS